MRRLVEAVKPFFGTILVCEEPAEGATVTPGMVVSGWAFSSAGIKEISVWLDGQRVAGEVKYGILREDVAKGRPEWPNALRSGFQYRLEDIPAAAPGETAEVAIVAEDGRGRRTEVRRAVRPVEQVLVCEEPAKGAAVTLGTVVSGWAFSSAGIKEISIWLDGQLLGKAAHGLQRQDVAAAFPSWPDALRSGFQYHLDASAAPPLPRAAELMIMAEDSEGHQVEEHRLVQAVETPPLPMGGSLDIPKLRPPKDPLREMGWSSPLVVFGWAVDTEGVDRIDVLLDGQVVGHAEHGLPREDVESLRWEYRRLGLAERSGWLAVIPTEGFGPGEHTLTAIVHGRSGTLDLGPERVWLRADSVRVDSLRQQRLETLLRCPWCRQPLGRGEADLACSSCGRSIRSSEFGTLLFDETYADLDWRDAVATSHSYPPEAVDVILDCRDGLVLDIGAGLRENLPNVVQLDAIAFPTTDVSANAEALPFAGESFDGVIACNLLEHVSQPAAVVREMRRVCKMGGRIYADFTSVHPYHGFPHHYFNATETGLDWLMREMGGATGSVAVTDARIAVRLVLEAWMGSLEDAGARDLAERLPVGDLVALLKTPADSPDLYAVLGRVFPNGGRLIPPKVAFAGVRTR